MLKKYNKLIIFSDISTTEFECVHFQWIPALCVAWPVRMEGLATTLSTLGRSVCVRLTTEASCVKTTEVTHHLH